MVLRNLSTSVSEIFHSTHFIRTILTFPVQPVLVARALRANLVTPFSPRSWNISIGIHISYGSSFEEELAFLISRHPVFRARDCACPFSFGAQYQFPDRFYIRGPPHPLQFRFIPSFFAHPPRKRSSSVLLFYVLALDFLFSSGGFFFLTTSHSSPQTPIVKSTLPRTDTPFVRVLHTLPHPNTPPLPHPSPTPPHSVTPFLLVPACAAASSLGKYQRSSCLGYPTRGNETSRKRCTFGRYSFVSSYATVCVRARPIVTTS